jgi:hypothetical protein
LPLLSLSGPFGNPIIATLNFDVALEQIAANNCANIYDGFSRVPDPSIPAPESFLLNESTNLSQLWNTAHNNLCPFIGFPTPHPGSVEIVKLHGSLGRFNIEEGFGDIGNRADLRQNTVYAHLKLPLAQILDASQNDTMRDLAIGGEADCAMRSTVGPVTRKAGAVWLRPNMIFARATKLQSDSLSLCLFGHFSRALARTKNVLVLGYSWSDVHINELIFHAIANGADRCVKK